MLLENMSINDMMSPVPDPEIFNNRKILNWPGNHVFLIKVSEYFEEIKNNFQDILSETECKKADKFTRAADRINYIARKYVLRNLLSTILRKNAKDIQFSQIANKKPFVSGVSFNVSHTEDLAVIAISYNPVGIDTELVRSDFSYDIMLNDCFSKSEQMTIKQSASSLKSFYTLWTRKEALLKACGAGLSNNNLNELDVHLPVHIYAGQSYRIYSSDINENYIVSSAWSCDEPKIKYWKL